MSDHPVRRVSRFVRNHPWAIMRDKLDAICEIVEMRSRGITLSQDEVQARIGAAAQRRETSIVNAVAVIPLYGVIAQKMNAMTAISGGTSTEQFMAQVRAAVADESVKGVVIDCDTPGGTIEGVIEAADELFKLRGTKPIIAVANPWIASAGYWLAAQCDEIVCMPSGQVGSIGVFCVHDDVSAMNEAIGYKPTYIYFGDYKVETNEDHPLADEALAYLTQQVNARGADFVKAVARGRGVSVATVKAQFGQGRMLFAKDALAAQMIDRIGTLDDTIGRLMGRRSGAGLRVAANLNEVKAALADGKDQIAQNAAALIDEVHEHKTDAVVEALSAAAAPATKADTVEPDESAVDDGVQAAVSDQAAADRDALAMALALTE